MRKLAVVVLLVLFSQCSENAVEIIEEECDERCVTVTGAQYSVTANGWSYVRITAKRDCDNRVVYWNEFDWKSKVGNVVCDERFLD